ncbi:MULTISPECIES: BON domain-containing protein [unclassified Pseudomonas]|uniref:BON domain-containing protein n=1 Tax=unclassified Pseudomonas TaxID=196821 RepID=UPI000D3AB535|nr:MULTISPECIES: BON domain-containing protein [unclassified Pseudomonas]RAU42278.1 BON domain-containing protein [Pseudomonas sp. RIT 409]RAU55073.1 BON domain-containing protein [Pseudomonas sp. RIT 412]
MNDHNLRDNIIDELELLGDIDPAQIGVTVEHGVVTLSGHVCAYSQKAAIEKIVKGMKGVRAIAEEIKVRPAVGKQVADDQIATRAADIINWTAHLPEGTIKIKVQDGWVELDGEVEWQYQRDAIVRAVRMLSGVVAVTNLIRLRRHPVASDIKQRIDDALQRSAEVDAQQIQVSVKDDVVTLEGRINILHERDAIERTAWSVPGVRKVENHLVVA